MNNDLFPILRTEEIFNILNMQLNYKMITLDLLNTPNQKNNSSSTAIINFYKNFIFDYQLSDNINNNVKLLKFLQLFFMFLGINDFNLMDLYNCNDLTRLHRSLSCIINFIRFSQERLKHVNNLIVKINIQSKLDIIDTKLSYVLSGENSNNLKELELNYTKKLNILSINNNNKINELTQQIQHHEMHLEKLISMNNEMRKIVDVVETKIIDDLLVNKISQNLITLKKNLNSIKNDNITISKLEETLNKNKEEIDSLQKNTGSVMDNDYELSEITNTYQALMKLKSVINLESTVSFNTDDWQEDTQKALDKFLPQWKNITQRKLNLLHVENNNIISNLNQTYNEIYNSYNGYKEQILTSYDSLIQEINDYVSNIIEYL